METTLTIRQIAELSEVSEKTVRWRVHSCPGTHAFRIQGRTFSFSMDHFSVGTAYSHRVLDPDSMEAPVAVPLEERIAALQKGVEELTPTLETRNQT